MIGAMHRSARVATHNFLALGLEEIVEGIFEFHAGTPDGKARQERALALWREQKYDEVFQLHEEIVEQDLKPALEKLGVVEVPQISEHLRKGYSISSCYGMTLTQKTISLPENLYNRLKAKKKSGENFPDVISRLLDQEECHQKPSITKFFGILGENSEEWDKIEEEIYAKRAHTSDRAKIDLDER